MSHAPRPRPPRRRLSLRRDAARGHRHRPLARADGPARPRRAGPARRDRRRAQRRRRLGRSADDERPVPAHAAPALHAGPRVGGRDRLARRRGRARARAGRRRPRRRPPRGPALARRLPGLRRLRDLRRGADGGRAKDPGSLTFDQAASLLGSYETAYHCLVTRGRLQAGETVLIHGAWARPASPRCKSPSSSAPR